MKLNQAISYLISQILQLPEIVEQQNTEIRNLKLRVEFLEQQMHKPKRRKK